MTRPRAPGWLLALVAMGSGFGLATGCQRDRVRSHLDEPWPERLSEWRLFKGDGTTLEPNPGVLPYEVATPLFSDYADKLRTVWMPPGASARYDGGGAFALPVGTILSKTFTYPREGGGRRLVETRLLVHGQRGWVALPYVWDEEETEARLEIVGAIIPVAQPARGATPARTIRYVVPNVNQCQGCHEQDKAMVPIGVQARFLNRPSGGENQLQRWARHGYLSGAPEPQRAPRHVLWEEPGDGDVEARARTYLDANCAHCHSPKGPAASSGLDLRSSVTEPRLLGVCKQPVAAGRGSGPGMDYDVVPGQPEKSILVYRMRSTDPGVMMPELGRTLVHAEAVELISEWIRRMSGRCEI